MDSPPEPFLDWRIAGAVAALLGAVAACYRVVMGWFTNARARERLDTLFTKNLEQTGELQRIVSTNSLQIASLHTSVNELREMQKQVLEALLKRR